MALETRNLVDNSSEPKNPSSRWAMACCGILGCTFSQTLSKSKGQPADIAICRATLPKRKLIFSHLHLRVAGGFENIQCRMLETLPSIQDGWFMLQPPKVGGNKQRDEMWHQMQPECWINDFFLINVSLQAWWHTISPRFTTLVAGKRWKPLV